MSSVRAEIAEQIAANVSGVPHYATFATHRERLTARVLDGLPRDSAARLCVLGAGNCYDLDLERLAFHFREIHLVDLDAEAITRAYERQTPHTQARLVCHPPTDLSGLLNKLESWSAFQVTHQDLLRYPHATAKQLQGALGQFELVVSACLLTQMQLAVVNVLGDTHPLFAAVRQSLTLAHLRTLSELCTAGGRALLVTDLTADALFPALAAADAEPAELLRAALAAGAVFDVADPGMLAEMIQEDPVLARDAQLSEQLESWVWQNGPTRKFLVYVLELTRA